MLNKFGGLREYEGEPGFLYGDTLFVSDKGELWTGCLESKTFTHYAVVHGTPRKYIGLRLLDRVVVGPELSPLVTLSRVVPNISPIIRPRKVTIMLEYASPVELICQSSETAKTEFNWFSGVPDRKAAFGLPVVLHQVGTKTSLHLLGHAMYLLKIGLPRPKSPAGIQAPIQELSRKFDLFLLAWLKREMKKRGIDHRKYTAA